MAIATAIDTNDEMNHSPHQYNDYLISVIFPTSFFSTHQVLYLNLFFSDAIVFKVNSLSSATH